MIWSVLIGLCCVLQVVRDVPCHVCLDFIGLGILISFG